MKDQNASNPSEQVWHERTGAAIARVGDAPFTAELVEATDMQALESDYVLLKSEIDDAMTFLDKKGILRGNGEDQFTLTGRIQGIFEGGEGLQGQYRLQHESIKAFRELWKLLPNRLIPVDDYEADRMLVKDVSAILESLSNNLLGKLEKSGTVGSVTTPFTSEELEAISELANSQNLTNQQVIRQALRVYQYSVKKGVSISDCESLKEKAATQKEELKRIASMNEKQKEGLKRIASILEVDGVSFQEVEQAAKELKDWKDSTLKIENEWDVQLLAKKLGGVVGASCRKTIHEGVLNMESQIIMAYCDLADAIQWTRHMNPTLKQVNLPRVVEAVINELRSVKDSLRSENEKLRKVVSAAEAAGWNGVENSKILEDFIKDLGEKASLLDDQGPDGRNVRNEEHARVLLENENLRKVLQNLETRVFEAEQRVQRLTKARVVSSSWAEASDKIHDDLKELGLDPYKQTETSAPIEIKLEHPNTSGFSNVELAHKYGLRIQCRHELSEDEEEGEVWTNTIRTDFDNPELEFRIHPDDRKRFALIKASDSVPADVPADVPDPDVDVDVLDADVSNVDVPTSDKKELGEAGTEQEEEEKKVVSTENFLKEWEKWVSETATYFDCGGGDITYPLLGLVGELGELVNSIVKYYRKADLITLKIQDLPQDLRQKLKDESYDALHFLMFLLNEQGLSLEEIIDYGRKKLEKRMEEGTIHKENRISGSIVGKKVLITDLSGRQEPQEAFITKESMDWVFMKTLNRLPSKYKIEIIGDSYPGSWKGKKTSFIGVNRNKFYEALK